MKCFRCGKEIKKAEHYYSFSEWHKKLIRTDYAHKECWEKFLKQVSDTTEAMSVVRGLKSHLTKLGMLPPEEVVIK